MQASVVTSEEGQICAKR